jgi:hypothetical protein
MSLYGADLLATVAENLASGNRGGEGVRRGYARKSANKTTPAGRQRARWGM